MYRLPSFFSHQLTKIMAASAAFSISAGGRIGGSSSRTAVVFVCGALATAS